MGYIVINDKNFEVDNVAITLSFFDLGNLLQRTLSFTKTVRLPLVASDELGLVKDYRSLTSVPYTNLTSKYVSRGVELLSGYSLISKVDNKIQLNIYDTRINLFDSIKGRKLYELGYLTDSAFHASDIDGFRANTSGIMCPVIDWGVMSFADLSTGFYLPSFSYIELIQEIFSFAGYTVSGDVLTDTEISKLIIPYSLDAFEYPQVFRDRWHFYATKVSIQSSFTIETTLTFNGIVSEGAANPYSGSPARVIIPTLGATGDYIQLSLDASFRFSATGTAGNDFYFRLIRLRGGGETTLDEELFTMVASGLNADVQLSVTTDLRDGDEVYVKYVPNTGSPSITVPAEGFFRGVHTGLVFDNYVFWNYLLPDITMDALMKDFLIRAGVVPLESGGNISLRTIEDIITQRHLARDWTDKRVSFDEVNLTPPYAKANYFKYEDLIEDDTLGRGSIDINDDKLQSENDTFTSIFGNSTFKTNSFINCARIPVYDATSVDRADFKESPGLRLLTTRSKKTQENSVLFDAIFRTDYLVGLFEQTNETVGAGFQRFIDKYYKSVELSLNNFKGIKARYILDETDLMDDVLLIFDTDSYYVVSKVDSFVKPGITKVEMFKV